LYPFLYINNIYIYFLNNKRGGVESVGHISNFIVLVGISDSKKL